MYIELGPCIIHHSTIPFNRYMKKEKNKSIFRFLFFCMHQKYQTDVCFSVFSSKRKIRKSNIALVFL